MNIFFGTTEMRTLNDLQVLAEKHNMKIHFGFSSTAETDMDYEILEKNDIDSCVIDIIKNEDCLTINDSIATCDKLWFELYDKANDKSHTMAYLESGLAFNIDDSNYYFSEQKLEYEYRKALEDFMNGEDYFCYNYSPTIINCFGNKETVTDFRVYRSGMALKFFGDLVCDFLGEPRIERVY